MSTAPTSKEKTLVERLRTDAYMTSALRRQAADEIERLQNALAQSVETVRSLSKPVETTEKP